MILPTRCPDITLTCPKGLGPDTIGEALVSQHGFSARYDLDRDNGVFSRKEHDLFGMSYVNKILIFPTSKGGIATSWMLSEMKSRESVPLGLIFASTNPVMVQGAALADLPIMHRCQPKPHLTINSGDIVKMEPAAGSISVWHSNTLETRGNS